MVKAKQIEYLINSLPQPEPEEVQVRIHAVVGLMVVRQSTAGSSRQVLLFCPAEDLDGPRVKLA